MQLLMPLLADVVPATKVCAVCGVEKVYREGFYTNKTYKECRECAIVRARAYATANPDRVRANTRRWSSKPSGKKKKRDALLRCLYGIGEAEYDLILKKQGGVCAICKTIPPTRKCGRASLTVDHCHKTGVVRGILCYRCNVALGNFDDDPAAMRVAAAYVEKFQ